MVVQLTPDQIGTHWSKISDAITKADPDASPQYIARCLEATIQGRVQVWVANEGESLKAICVTGFFLDPTGVRILVIIALEGEGMTEEDYEEGREAIWNYARAYDCSYISAFVDNPKVASRFKQLVDFKEEIYLTIKV